MDSRSEQKVDARTLASFARAYAELGGRQINITGGEPLIFPGLADFIESIDNGRTRIVLNSNGLLYKKLTDRALINAVDTILVSLHTVDPEIFTRDMGGKNIRIVQQGILALRDHGYRVKINCSLGPHNAAGIHDVIKWADDHGIDLKIIALIRPEETEDFYHGSWVDPAVLEEMASERGVLLEEKDQLGGHITTWRTLNSTLEIKNIARGRMRTQFCEGCSHTDTCGEGIYGLRIGIDGWMKPCLLRKEKWNRININSSAKEQILNVISEMVGDMNVSVFARGAPL